MKTLAAKLLAASLLLASLVAQAEIAPHSPNRLIVKLQNGATLPAIQGLKWKNLFGDVYSVTTNSLDNDFEQLQREPQVVYVEHDYYGTKNKISNKILEISVIQENKGGVTPGTFNDPGFSKQWALQNAKQYGMSVLGAYQNRRTTPKEQIVVAVVDTGVDINHEDLPIWKNEKEIPGNKIDDDNNGYIDDINGINTLVRDAQGRATMDNRDAHSHGTHVSGSIGAIQNNGKGVVGVAEKVKIMGIRTVPNDSDELDVDVIEAFIYAAKNGARIINCSFGKAHNEGGMAVSEAIDFIGKNYNVLVVVAAGNSSQDIDRTPTYPASFTNDNLLVVASTSSSGGMSYFSNFGAAGVDIAAPGSNIYSSIPNNRYGNMSGTSMASPNTAGVAAEVLSHFPELSAVELKEVLMRSAVKVGGFQGRIVSGARVDLQMALESAGSALGRQIPQI